MSGNLRQEAEFLGEQFLIEREGTDGDVRQAMARIAELDGKVDAIGLGGTDLYLVAGNRRYVWRETARMAAVARRTPVVDGSGLKDTLERGTVRWLQRDRFARCPDGKRGLWATACGRRLTFWWATPSQRGGAVRCRRSLGVLPPDGRRGPSAHRKSSPPQHELAAPSRSGR